MDSPAPPADTAHVPGATYRFTAVDIDRMVDANILDSELRFELWDGQILLMSPFRPPGSRVHSRLNRLFHALCPAHIEIRSEKPIDINDPHFQPEPDVSLADDNRDSPKYRHPVARDLYLVVEISDTTKDYDLTKIPKYAQANIRESWIVDVAAEAVTVYRKPHNGHYQSISEPHTGHDRLTVEAFPHINFAVADIFM